MAAAKKAAAKRPQDKPYRGSPGRRQPVRDTGGRFTSAGQKQQNVITPANRDELPATVGYVKCIARIVFNSHRHKNNVMEIYGWNGVAALFIGIITGFVTFIVWPFTSRIFEDLVIIGWAITITCLIQFIVALSAHDCYVYSSPEASQPDAIKRYEPPTEEPKKEC